MNQNVVTTNINYSSPILHQNLVNLLKLYPFLNVQIVSNSVLGTPIYVIKLGTGPKQVFYSAGIHANEWITSIILMKFIEDYSKSYASNNKLYNYSINDIFNSCSIYIMPMINPDGIDLVTGYLQQNSSPYIKAEKIASNFPYIPFTNGWKSNINGVDLNLQFPAGWKNAKEIKYAQGFTTPAPRDFVGTAPLTEPESIAVYNFTLQHNFDLILSYHSQGEVIYWQFQDYNPPNIFYIGTQFSNISGYSLEDTPYNSSFAGYKDWFIQTYNKPGYTIEVGKGINPLPLTQFDQIYNENIGILLYAAYI